MTGEQYDIFGAIEREKFKARLLEGEKMNCPCCNRHAQVYHRQLYSSSSVQLIRLFKLGGAKERIHLSEIMPPGKSGGGDFTLSKHWGLVQSPDYEGDEKRTNGLWQLTPKGVEFIKGNLSIPRYALIFDDEVLRFEGEQVDIEACLGKRFDYHELMNPMESEP